MISSIAALAPLGLPAVSQGARKPTKTRAVTGGATHVRSGAALLTATILPNGNETSYYFQYGQTTAYGQQTPVVNVGHGETRVRVGAPITGLHAGVVYHFRVVATNPGGAQPILGHDRFFTVRGTKLAFLITRPPIATYGVPFIFTGLLTGLGSPNHRISLQASPFPYLESFATIGTPGVTNAAGAFSFRVGNLTRSTQFRVVTADLLPVYSRVVTVELGAHVVLHVRSSGHRGLVRFYGTVTPAINGASVAFQVQKATRPRGKNETTVRWANEFATTTKKGIGNSSRFSLIATIRKGGRYRASVKLKTGPIASGVSATTFVLRAAPEGTRKKK
jgi:hypothetical protein